MADLDDDIEVRDEPEIDNEQIDLLSEIAHRVDWYVFEAQSKGSLLLDSWSELPCPPEHVEPSGPYRFDMRVGLLLGKPVQAIMSNGYFVRTRSASQFNDYEMVKLDPKYPDRCLYAFRRMTDSGHSHGISTGGYGYGTTAIGPTGTGVAGVQGIITAAQGLAALYGAQQNSTGTIFPNTNALPYREYYTTVEPASFTWVPQELKVDLHLRNASVQMQAQLNTIAQSANVPGMGSSLSGLAQGALSGLATQGSHSHSTVGYASTIGGAPIGSQSFWQSVRQGLSNLNSKIASGMGSSKPGTP